MLRASPLDSQSAPKSMVNGTYLPWATGRPNPMPGWGFPFSLGNRTSNNEVSPVSGHARVTLVCDS